MISQPHHTYIRGKGRLFLSLCVQSWMFNAWVFVFFIIWTIFGYWMKKEQNIFVIWALFATLGIKKRAKFQRKICWINREKSMHRDSKNGKEKETENDHISAYFSRTFNSASSSWVRYCFASFWFCFFFNFRLTFKQSFRFDQSRWIAFICTQTVPHTVRDACEYFVKMVLSIKVRYWMDSYRELKESGFQDENE